MGTEIYEEEDMYIKRFWGGEEKGMRFFFDIKGKILTQEETMDFISKMVSYLIIRK